MKASETSSPNHPSENGPPARSGGLSAFESPVRRFEANSVLQSQSSAPESHATPLKEVRQGLHKTKKFVPSFLLTRQTAGKQGQENDSLLENKERK